MSKAALNKPAEKINLIRVTPQREVPEGKRPWIEEVEERMEKHEQLLAVMTPEERALWWEGRCQANTTGTYGPKRRCTRMAILGHRVCPIHGGSAKATKDAAKRAFMEEVHPTINRLREIRDQDEHMPSALGASVTILNRALGKPEQKESNGPGKTTIKVGILLGGLPAGQVQKQITVESESPEAIDAEYADDSE